jgi:putative ABC transport system permease protein
MRPDQRDLDDEIRGHLALAIRERIERGEHPASARLAALRELGYVPAVRESMRRVWFGRWADAGHALAQDVRIAARSLARTKALAVTVIVTLALGIGANAAIFSVVREVLLRPLANRDADRLMYIRQHAPGLGLENALFSVPEIQDLRSGARTIEAFGDFSTIDFTLIGIGEPRVVRAGVVDGSFFEVMGLHPVLGRLLDARDDGPRAAGAVVLTHRFWSDALDADPAMLGRTIQLGTRPAIVVGVLEPSVPYPAETEIIANVVTSPHHLGAVMVTERGHRMTELFGRLAQGATIEDARVELEALHAAMRGRHPDTYTEGAGMRLTVTPFHTQLTAPARPVLLVLLAASALVFLIACSNVANLILSRSVRREDELAVRAALGASRGALRRTLLAESLVLCGAGAAVGLLLARPLVGVIAGFASRFSARGLDVTVDANLLWTGIALALAAAVLLAFVPKLPHTLAAPGADGGRSTLATHRRLRLFATAQIAFTFVLLTGAGALLAALLILQRTPTGYDMQRVIAFDVPRPIEEESSAVGFYEDAVRRVGRLPGVTRAALGNFVPWRDVSGLLPAVPFSADGHVREPGEEDPHARLRIVSPGYFDTLGVPLIAGRDFTAADEPEAELVVIVNQALAQRMFPNGAALDRQLWWTHPYFGPPRPRRIVGIVADADDESLVPAPAPTVYHPFRQMAHAGRLFVRTSGEPSSIIEPVIREIRALANDQPIERAATLADVRKEVLEPERLTAAVVGAFAGVALVIATVGIAGVLAFSVSARTREFGVRLALGATPVRLLVRVLGDGAVIVFVGVAGGAAAAGALWRLDAAQVGGVVPPGAIPMLGAAGVLAVTALLAALVPAARAARVNVVEALRTE